MHPDQRHLQETCSPEMEPPVHWEDVCFPFSSVCVSQLCPEVPCAFFSADCCVLIMWLFFSLLNVAFSRISLFCCSRKGTSPFLL